METNSKRLLEAIPDFREFMALSEEIKQLYYEKMVVENQIKQTESDNFNEVMSNPKYFINGKVPPVSYYENAYKFAGLNGEIAALRTQLATVVSSLDMKRMQYDIYKQMIEMYKSATFQERAMS